MPVFSLVGIAPQQERCSELSRGTSWCSSVLSDPVACLVISRSGIRLAKLASRARIETLVDRFTQDLRSGKGNATGAAKELHEAVLMPIKEWRTAQRLLVVPDGRLHLLPFDALLTQNAIVGRPSSRRCPLPTCSFSFEVDSGLRSRSGRCWESEACHAIECSPPESPRPAQHGRAKHEGSWTPLIQRNCHCSQLRRVKL